MDLTKYRCLSCEESQWQTYSTLWRCAHCGQQYPCVNGMPKLYNESSLGRKDKALRDYFYNGFLGTYYRYIMPFLALPVRPAYWGGWLAYGAIVGALASAVGYLFFFVRSPHPPTALDLTVLLLLLAAVYFLYKHPYLFYLILLAVPVKISLLFTKFRPVESFPEVHARLVREFSGREAKLQVLDISTGTCNSLFRHGWMKLDADYTGLDLSETMLTQGLHFMSDERVPMEFVLGDATYLPFRSGAFDIVLNYGAINGMTDPRRALEEMARVCKRGGLVFFLDEQLYDTASFVERLYFKTVLSSHNVIHRCPVDLIPPDLERIKVHQVYHFYYLCEGFKKSHHPGGGADSV